VSQTNGGAINPPEIPVAIVAQTEYVDSHGFAHVIGVVQNVGTQPLSGVKVNATFFDSQNTVVSTAAGLSMMELLLPGTSAPFDASANMSGLAIASYSVKVTNYFVMQPGPVDVLNITGVTSNNTGSFEVSGQVSNFGTSDANTSEVVATFYNSTGGVIAVESTFASPVDIQSGQAGSFSLAVNGTSSIASYTLEAEANTLSVSSPIFISGEYNYTV
jgi:hypothetical protein